MAEWCAENLRDVQGWNASGLPMTSTCNEAAKLLDGAIRQVVSMRDCDKLGGMMKTFENLAKFSKENAMVTAFLTGMDALGTKKSILSDENFRKSVKEADKFSEAKTINDRERMHLKAAVLFASGDMPGAEAMWESILSSYPNDLIAIKFVHDSYFFSGSAEGKRDSIARILPRLSPNEPCYSFILGMYAFGLEECAEYAKAEEIAHKAISIRKEDPWAIHAIAHVMEMQGRRKESLEFLGKMKPHWEPARFVACHIHWHMAAVYIEEGDYRTALRIYDREVYPRAKVSDSWLDNADAISMLWRLELQGMDVGDRWKILCKKDEHLHDHALSFNDVHIGMCLKRAGFLKEERELHKSMVKYVNSGKDTSTHRVARDVGLPLYEGMIAFADEDYEKAIERVMSVRKGIFKISGSHAQNDIFTQTLILACINSGKAEHIQLAKRILSERDLVKPNSGISDRIALRLRG